ncbi:MAG: toll/interleukin-1 receptor domain-containing protein [Anaerolineales bacterium]|nr:toll/interleukin-1 receptor domain-containing protein [Anaerolineales bacterium]
MKPNTFISYSRQCIGFVDDLAHRLEKQEFKVWLDYRSLIPGRPWLEQIHSGLEEAELLLLVVSPESISSRSVEVEWRYFLEHNKRIILLIFQAVPLPPELAGLEWVDFRGGYGPALKKLLRRIEAPAAMEGRAPQSGFKAPAMVWLAAGISLITSLYSLFAFWTFLIPWVLVPLPVRIFKRDFNLSQVQTALWTLPIALFFTFGLSLELGIVNGDADFDYNNVYSLYNFVLLALFLQVYLIPLISILQLFILRSPAMQRWGMPEASVPKFANIYRPNISQPEPVHYYIEYAPQDARIANELAAELRKYGHSPAEELTSADEVLVLLSRFKSDTGADPEKQVVYPILIQRTKLPEKLSKVQWIDFRKGVRNLEAIAKLLPQPVKMLAALGVRPTSSRQASMPNVVLVLVDFLIIMGMVDFGSFISYMLELTGLNVRLVAYYESTNVLRVLFLHMLCMALSGWLIYFMVQSLSERRGWFASPGTLLLGLTAVLLLFYGQGLLGDSLDTIFKQYGIVPETLFAFLPFVLFISGGFLVAIAVLFRYKALLRWFPAKVK